MKKYILLSIGLIVLLVGGFFLFRNSGLIKTPTSQILNPTSNDDSGGMEDPVHPLSIESLRKGEYPGSDFIIEQTLDPGSNYNRYIVSYKSEGLKIYGLLTIPTSEMPEGGYPAIIFNHGYIAPTEYRTTERYIAYTDAFSRNGYILFRPDYRGHGNSEGSPAGAYGSNGYTIDVLNALASVKKLKDPNDNSKQIINNQKMSEALSLVNPNKIGMWGHSMGGFITLRNMVVSKDIKAGVIWAGVVGSYDDLFTKWRRRSNPNATPNTRGGGWRQMLQNAGYGTPESNPTFWRTLSANYYLKDISGPVQLHHGTADASVPVDLSEILAKQLRDNQKEVEEYYYEGDDHNIAANLGIALQRSVDFFDKQLK